MNKTAEEIYPYLENEESSIGIREHNQRMYDCRQAYNKGFAAAQFAAPPPASEGEKEEVIWGEPLRNSYNKGFLDSKKEQIMDFIKWFGEQDLKRYAEGWCQPGGSNGFHYSDDDLYKLFCNRENGATLPTREQGGEKEKFAIRFSEWLMIQCEYKNHCVWEYRGEEYTQNELIEIFKRTTPLPSPPKH